MNRAAQQIGPEIVALGQLTALLTADPKIGTAKPFRVRNGIAPGKLKNPVVAVLPGVFNLDRDIGPAGKPKVRLLERFKATRDIGLRESQHLAAIAARPQNLSDHNAIRIKSTAFVFRVLAWCRHEY
jgi:hypothetical protein